MNIQCQNNRTRTVMSQSCPQCKGRSCPRVESCAYGIGLDSCKCCLQCLLGPSKFCGGTFNELGVCGHGLTCKPESKHILNYFRSAGKCVWDNENYWFRSRIFTLPSLPVDKARLFPRLPREE
ncbi:Single insulin-like growth factor-binding domain protein-1 [Armadillidium nasatum]|uniref:Single insulin-like growth factor-binding domain protein-1 n=1 Tax=Armadillidium nasatum TaxID=96803 RepID=A0A5N5SQY1_9CRUS|nr:Single insulin-like growth factor-binding domain protein-1 [Armadillidium nasatum]